MKILVVDDDANLARSIKRMLRGHEVFLEHDSAAAVARVMKADVESEPFELVLCDFNMPCMSGLDVGAALLSFRTPPAFVLMSGDDDVIEAASVAVCALLKPFGSTEVGDVIERIRQSRSRAKTQRLHRISVQQFNA